MGSGAVAKHTIRGSVSARVSLITQPRPLCTPQATPMRTTGWSARSPVSPTLLCVLLPAPRWGLPTAASSD